MQVNVHSIDRTEVVDFREPSEDHHAFVAVKVFDGKGSEVAFLLSDVRDAYRLMESARRVWQMLGDLANVES